MEKLSKLYRGSSIDASYQVSVHLAKRFRRRRFLKIGQSEKRIACSGHENPKWTSALVDNQSWELIVGSIYMQNSTNTTVNQGHNVVQLMGVHKVSAFHPYIFQKSGKLTIIRNLAVPHHFVAYHVFISSIRVDPGSRNRSPTSLLALKIRTPVANTGKLRSIGQVSVLVYSQKYARYVPKLVHSEHIFDSTQTPVVHSTLVLQKLFFAHTRSLTSSLYTGACALSLLIL